MVSFRPHKIRKVSNEEFITLENGDIVKGEQTFSPFYECRYESNGQGRSIALADGKAMFYSYTVYMDQDAPDFGFGESVELVGLDGESRGQYLVLGFHRGQLDCKLWV